MKFRIIGTKGSKYVKDFLSLNLKAGDEIHTNNLGILFNICDSKKKASIVFKTQVTRRQCLEVWEAYGLIKNDGHKYTILSSPNYGDIIKLARKAIVEISMNDTIQVIRNSKMLCIEDSITKISDKKLSAWKIVQKRGTMNNSKIKKEFSEFEKDMKKDDIFIAKMKERLYEEINKEL